ncbi:hypothetical protein NKH10_27485 [Mesorhizobium sp. M1340]|uniref:hypothetical protein n=1 Tax=unclassified Mesorhizobium TaxID=325217 RepID=UPI00333CA31B
MPLTLGSDYRTFGPTRGIGEMAEEQGRPGLKPEIVSELARESGVSEHQIREIMSLVGFDRGSILREARLLKKNK